MNTQNPSVWPAVVRGVAFGDAWGDPNEFRQIKSLVADNPMGPKMPDKMRITDDTQMTLFLADALAETWGQAPEVVKAAINQAFLDYAIDPDNNRAPGNTVMGSLHALRRNPSDWKNATSRHSDGSGTVMRTTPTAFLPEDLWVGITAYAAAVTHGTANAIAAAILNAKILRDIIDGKVKEGGLVDHALALAETPGEMLDVGDWLDGYEIPSGLQAGYTELARLLQRAKDVLPSLAKDPWGEKSDPSLWIGGGGWRAHETLVIALLAIDMFGDDHLGAFEPLRRSVTTDGDSDTIGAVAGGLLGALDPEDIMAGWKDYSSSFEPRYIKWIEDEADAYPWVA